MVEAETQYQASSPDNEAGAELSAKEAKEQWVPRPGETIAGRFRVERVIGEGGMGAVVAAKHLEMGNEVAIKFLHPHLTDDRESIERFIREAKIAAQIRSEHVVCVLDVGQTPAGLPYIVMDLLRGADLGKMLGNGPLAIGLAVDCVLQAGEALAEAHAQGIVHRDIKPANLWLAQRSDGTPTVKVLDFGISKLIPNDRHTAGITDTKASFGSPAYMSPEQIRSAKRVDHRTDVFALGVVLFELLTNRMPFDADNVAGILAAIISDPPQSLGRLRPEAPPELERVVRTMLEKDPNHRSSLAEVAAGLLPFAGPAGRTSAARIAGIAAPAPAILPPVSSAHSEDMIALGKTEPSLVTQRPKERRLPLVWSVALVAATVAVTVGGGGVYIVMSHKPPAAAPPPAVAESLPAPQAPIPPPTESAQTPIPAIPSVVPAVSARPPPKPATRPPVVHRPAPAPAPDSPLSDDRHWR